MRLFDPLEVLNIRKFPHFKNKVDHDESFELSFNIDFVRVRAVSCAARGTTLAAALAVVPLHYGTTLAVVPAQLGGGTVLTVVPVVPPL